jgi:uncharacterized protein (TIGR04255 family)
MPPRMTEASLPTYENPPLVETILNVQFEPLREFKTAHLGAFWKQLGPGWPHADDAPVVEPTFERFSDEPDTQELGLRFMLLKSPLVRLQVRNASDDGMIQIQNGRLIYNWLKKKGKPYPRYDKIRESFADTFQQFRAFLASEQLGEIKANQWEITYLNHIPQNTVWKSLKDWHFFRPLGSLDGIEGLVKLDNVSEKRRYVIGENRGRLHVSWHHGKKEDRQELIVLNLTARGPLLGEKTNIDEVLDGLDLGRSAIVTSFSAFMADEANQYWGLKHASP